MNVKLVHIKKKKRTFLGFIRVSVLHHKQKQNRSFANRRMFPAMRVKISGLDPHQQYYIAMDIVPVDNKRYR